MKAIGVTVGGVLNLKGEPLMRKTKVTYRVGKPPQGARVPIRAHWTISVSNTLWYALIAILLGTLVTGTKVLGS